MTGARKGGKGFGSGDYKQQEQAGLVLAQRDVKGSWLIKYYNKKNISVSATNVFVKVNDPYICVER